MPGTVVFGSTVVEATARELLEHLDTPIVLKPFLDASPEEDRATFLQAMDELQESIRFLERTPQLECCVWQAQEGRALMEQARGKLLADAMALLAKSCISLQPDPHLRVLSDCSKHFTPVQRTGQEKDKEGKGGPHDPSTSPEGLFLPRILPEPAVQTLQAMTPRMSGEGSHTANLLNAYRAQREAWLKSAVESLGLQSLLEDSGRWKELERVVATWNEQLRVLASLSAVEDTLASQLLPAVPEAERKQLVASLASAWLEPLLQVGRRAAQLKKTPEKKFVPLLDMTEALLDAKETYQRISLDVPAGPGAQVQQCLEFLKDTLLDTGAELCKLVAEDEPQPQQPKEAQGMDREGSSRGHRKIWDIFGAKHEAQPKPSDTKESPISRGGQSAAAQGMSGDVDRMTKYVCNFIRFLMYKDLPYVRLLIPTLGSREAVRQLLGTIMQALNSTLEGKAKATADDGRLYELFWLNNKNYIVGKLGSSHPDIEDMLGRQWNSEIKRELEEHKANYLALLLDPFKAILNGEKDRELNAFNRRLTAFNSALEDLCTCQHKWRVPSTELSLLLRREEVSFIVPKYKEMLTTHRNFIESPRFSKSKLLPVPEVETQIMESFPEPKRDSKGEP